MAIDINRGSTNVILDPEVSGEIISKAIEESAFMQLAPRITIAGNGKKYQTITGFWSSDILTGSQTPKRSSGNILHWLER